MQELLSQLTISEWAIIISGISTIAVVFQQALELIFTRNTWLIRLLQKGWRWLKRLVRGRLTGVRTLILNCSGHPVHPAQKSAIEKLMHWQDAEVLDVELGNVPEDRHFVPSIEKAIDRLGLTSKEWEQPIVVIPAGYPPACSAIQSILHGRLGHFPDVVRLRRVDPVDGVRYEVAEIMSLQQLRHDSRGKR